MLHGGYQPERSTLTRGWLGLIYRVARPLAGRGVAPDLLTGWGVVVSGFATGLAGLGGRWPLLAAPVVVLAAALDSVDGAVAVLTDRATGFGHVLDSVADRVSDVAYLVALWLLGAPGWLCVPGGGLMLLQEYTRARAAGAGMAEIGVVTVWERPTRVILTAGLLLGAGLLTARAADVASWGAAGWVGLGVVGLTQLVVVVRRRLT